MEPKYLKLSLREKDVYFSISDIKKYHAYSAHGIDFCDYHVVINEFHVWDERDKPVDETYGGLFLYIDENKKIRIYDNLKKIYIDVENNEDMNNLTYFYEAKEYCDSIEYVVKEILLQFVIDN
jgi:hypothetical protein